MLKEPSAIVNRPGLPEQIVTNAYLNKHYPKDTSPKEIDNEYETFRRIGIAKGEAERTQKFLRTNNAEFLVEDDDEFFSGNKKKHPFFGGSFFIDLDL
ncbi:hypothetical protein [Limosilactobacillus reuteri]|uniref:hypothetical protein n=2 Tax=Limosilactobacillus reuteri TaxID=1598 RepID=UPI001E3FAEF3|nr:hypothetical protein [Limosilactobacillus reuteri]MCC4358745.1 hypothetical protein [Limosilactobacillus reuteri]MCC4363435.1 hypothetical protein [Limosilactobacillus reuteri]MCC4365225.1 hypothetical protein [Limosilactobacillus reuteri]